MTLSRTFAQCLAKNVAAVALIACAGVMLEASTETVRAETPGVTDCFNSSTGQIFTVQGKCP